MPTERFSKIPQKIESGLKEFRKGVLGLAYELTIEDPQNYLAEVNAFIDQGGSAVAYANHRSYGDGPIVCLFLLEYINSIMDTHNGMAVSHYHTNPKNNLWFYLGTKMVSSFLNAEVFRLIQPYMVGKAKYGSYTNDDVLINTLTFSKRLKKINMDYNHSTVTMFGEGHRNETGVLQPLLGGVTLAADKLNAVLFPLAIQRFPEKKGKHSSRDSLNFGPVHIVVGEPTFPEEFRGYLTRRDHLGLTTLLGRRLAKGLPDVERGIYG